MKKLLLGSIIIGTLSVCTAAFCEEHSQRDVLLTTGKCQGADFTKEVISYASKENVNLSDSTLEETVFYEVSLRNANFSHADMRNACLSKADLRKANFKGADLRNAIFIFTDLTGADLSEAKTDGTIFVDTIMPDGSLQR